MTQAVTPAARIAARIYAVVIVITGIGMFAGLALIAAAFGLRVVLDATLLTSAVSLAGIVLIVLGVFIWRLRLWAMIAGIVLSAILAIWLFDPTAYALVALAFAPVVFTILTVIVLTGRRTVTPA
jgi:hypothetical protein